MDFFHDMIFTVCMATDFPSRRSLQIFPLDILEVAVSAHFQFSGRKFIADYDAVRMSLECGKRACLGVIS